MHYARRQWARRSRGLIPCRRIQRLAVGIDGCLHILGEVGISNGRIAELLLVCLRQSDAFADLPAWTLRRFDNRDRAMVPLHDDFDASLHFL